MFVFCPLIRKTIWLEKYTFGAGKTQYKKGRQRNRLILRPAKIFRYEKAGVGQTALPSDSLEMKRGPCLEQDSCRILQTPLRHIGRGYKNGGTINILNVLPSYKLTKPEPKQFPCSLRRIERTLLQGMSGCQRKQSVRVSVKGLLLEHRKFVRTLETISGTGAIFW